MLHRTPFRAMEFRLHSFVVLAALVVASTAKGGTLPPLTAAARSPLCKPLREHRKGWQCLKKWETDPSQPSPPPPSGWQNRVTSFLWKPLNYYECWSHPRVSDVYWVKFPSHRLSYLVWWQYFSLPVYNVPCSAVPKFVYHKDKHWYHVRETSEKHGEWEKLIQPVLDQQARISNRSNRVCYQPSRLNTLSNRECYQPWTPPEMSPKLQRARSAPARTTSKSTTPVMDAAITLREDYFSSKREPKMKRSGSAPAKSAAPPQPKVTPSASTVKQVPKLRKVTTWNVRKQKSAPRDQRKPAPVVPPVHVHVRRKRRPSSQGNTRRRRTVKRSASSMTLTKRADAVLELLSVQPPPDVTPPNALRKLRRVRSAPSRKPGDAIRRLSTIPEGHPAVGVGTRVQVVGLKNDTRFNGNRGIIRAVHDEEKKTWKVEMSDGQLEVFNHKNLLSLAVTPSHALRTLVRTSSAPNPSVSQKRHRRPPGKSLVLIRRQPP